MEKRRHDPDKQAAQPTRYHVKVYKYGTLYSPILREKQKSVLFDRPKLMSKIHQLLTVHRTRMQQNLIRGSKCSNSLHQALQKAIRLCYEQEITESKLYPVGELFLELFQCTGNYLTLFSILLNRNDHQFFYKDDNILYPNVSTSVDKSNAFNYYLSHTCALKDEIHEWNYGEKLDLLNMEVESNTGVTPLIAAVTTRDPEFILALLRFGADPFHQLMFDAECERDPLELLIDDLNGLALFKRTEFSTATHSKLCEEELKALLCLRYMRRAVASIPVSTSNHVITCVEQAEYADDRVCITNKLEKKPYSMHQGVISDLNTDFFKPTMSLKHLCRCLIRKHIRINPYVCLPKAINTLPLPSPLKSYIDLQTD